MLLRQPLRGIALFSEEGGKEKGEREREVPLFGGDCEKFHLRPVWYQAQSFLLHLAHLKNWMPKQSTPA